jgi:6,7-dimethyl-8-ribityllumazine synthase
LPRASVRTKAEAAGASRPPDRPLETQDEMAEPRRDDSRPPPRLAGGRILIVEARFYDAIGAQLLDGARRAIEAAGATCEIVNVPGALEIPIAMAITLDAAARAGAPYDGAVALGCVIRGETYHFEIVAGESSRALIGLAVARGLALGNGILTVETEAQAEARADPARGDKGGDAARAALALAALKRELAAP